MPSNTCTTINDQNRQKIIHYSNSKAASDKLSHTIYLCEAQDERRIDERKGRRKRKRQRKRNENTNTKRLVYKRLRTTGLCVHEMKLVFVFGRQFNGGHSQLNIVQYDFNAQSELIVVVYLSAFTVKWNRTEQLVGIFYFQN